MDIRQEGSKMVEKGAGSAIRSSGRPVRDNPAVIYMDEKLQYSHQYEKQQ